MVADQTPASLSVDRAAKFHTAASFKVDYALLAVIFSLSIFSCRPSIQLVLNGFEQVARASRP